MPTRTLFGELAVGSYFRFLGCGRLCRKEKVRAYREVAGCEPGPVLDCHLSVPVDPVTNPFPQPDLRIKKHA